MSWSPWWGCTQVSPACDHCYAEALDKRTGGDHWGVGKPRKEMSENHWRQPLKWNARVPAGETRFVFPSMCDPFDNEVPPAWRWRFFDLMRKTPNLTWLLLTKRIGNAKKMAHACGDWPANAALGATVVTQEEAYRDIPKLLDFGGFTLGGEPRFRFVSIEPMLEPIRLMWSWMENREVECEIDGATRFAVPVLDWVIVGGESGPRPRPMRPEWVATIRDQCAAAGVPFFFKQWGGRTPKANGKALDGREWCERPAPSGEDNGNG